jgi:hypothetical protein
MAHPSLKNYSLSRNKRSITYMTHVYILHHSDVKYKYKLHNFLVHITTWFGSLVNSIQFVQFLFIKSLEKMNL